MDWLLMSDMHCSSSFFTQQSSRTVWECETLQTHGSIWDSFFLLEGSKEVLGAKNLLTAPGKHGHYYFASPCCYPDVTPNNIIGKFICTYFSAAQLCGCPPFVCCGHMGLWGEEGRGFSWTAGMCRTQKVWENGKGEGEKSIWTTFIFPVLPLLLNLYSG